MSSYRQQSNKFFKIALIVSLIVHGVILFWKFVVPQIIKLSNEYDLKIVLVNGQTQATPSKADVLAQVNVQGGGDQAEGIKTSPLANTGKEVEGDSLIEQKNDADKTKSAEELAQENQRLLQQKKDALDALTRSMNNHETNVATLEQDKENLRKIETQLAVIAEKMNHASKSPRRIFFGASAKQADEVAYVKEFENRFKKESNLRYPPEIQGVYGKVRLRVALNKDGTINLIELVESSGKPVLDQAAQRLVKMAEPYGNFPPELLKKGSVFDFVSVYTFSNGQISEVDSNMQSK